MSFQLYKGQRPLLISMPHTGTRLPADSAGNFLPNAMVLADTDWHLEQLYDFARAMNVSLLLPDISRYVIDLNRPPDGTSLYSGNQTTELCPTTTFAGESLYPPGRQPDACEIETRLNQYWRPYHQALAEELGRLRDTHKQVVLFEAHSIRSEIERLFPGRLPDLNLGTYAGRSCDADLQVRVEACLSRQKDYSLAVNERFKGGYITRAYGRPEEGVHALQLELAQVNYMLETPPFRYNPARAERLQPLLKKLLDTLLLWAEEGGDKEGDGEG